MPKSKLEKMVSERLRMVFSGVTILENTRPDWLISSQGERLELDFYILGLDVAIEVQGQQHYTFVPHFHLDQNAFTDQLRRDREKRLICERKGIILLEIASSSEIDKVINQIDFNINPVEAEQDFIIKMKEQNKTIPRSNIKGKRLKKVNSLIKMRNNILRKMDRSGTNEKRQSVLDGIDKKLHKTLR